MHSFQGKADPLNSSFKLTYNMVLNLLRVEGINPEFMLERSFYQFQHFSTIPALQESKKNSMLQTILFTIENISELKKCEEQYESLKIENEEEVARYYKLKKKLESIQDQISVMTNEPKYLLPFLQPGRLVTVNPRKNGCERYKFDLSF